MILLERERVLLLATLKFIQTLSSPDLVPLAVSLGRKPQEFVQVCQELKRIEEQLEE